MLSIYNISYFFCRRKARDSLLHSIMHEPPLLGWIPSDRFSQRSRRHGQGNHLWTKCRYTARSATPAHLYGVETLTTESSYELWLRKSVHFVNVQPVLWRQDLFLPDQPLTIIPGSDWLPNVGFGQLEDFWADYLQHYAQHWGGMFIFFCTPDCWHSWKTTKRVAEKWPELREG